MRWLGRLEIFSHWRELALDLIYPPQCAWCDRVCPDSGRRICDVCRAGFVDRQQCCPICATTLAMASASAAVLMSPSCAHCKAERPRFQAAVRLAPYGGLLRTAILRLKQSKDPTLAMALAHLLVDQRGERLAELTLDVVVPMPMHWTRRIRRGVNNPDFLALTISQRLRLPCAPHLLRLRRRTKPQTGLTAHGRRANVHGAFRASSHPDLAGSRVLLVDDVMTTGATAGEAARTLRKAGVAEVAIAVLARAEGAA